MISFRFTIHLILRRRSARRILLFLLLLVHLATLPLILGDSVIIVILLIVFIVITVVVHIVNMSSTFHWIAATIILITPVFFILFLNPILLSMIQDLIVIVIRLYVIELFYSLILFLFFLSLRNYLVDVTDNLSS